MPAPVTFQRPAFTDQDKINAARFNSVSAQSATVPDASAGAEGVIRLTGDLTGAANNPQLITSGVTPGQYGQTADTVPVLTIDAKGRVTAATTRTIADNGVTAGSVGASGLNVPQLTIDAKGRVTASANRDITNAVKSAIFDVLYPVGEILITHRSGNPSTWLGFGTWSAHAAGRVLVGLNAADSDFDTIDKTGGAKTHTLATGELPAHTHGIPSLSGSTSTGGSHTHGIDRGPSFGSNNACIGSQAMQGAYGTNGCPDGVAKTAGDHSHSVTTNASTTGSAGSGSAHNNLQPFTVVAMWLRTA